MQVLPGPEYVARDILSATAYPASNLDLLQTTGNPALDEVEQLRPGTPQAGSVSMPATSSCRVSGLFAKSMNGVVTKSCGLVRATKSALGSTPG